MDLVGAWYHVMNRGHRGGLLFLPEKDHDKRWRRGVKRSAQALPGPDPAPLHRNVAAHIVDVIDATLLPALDFPILACGAGGHFPALLLIRQPRQGAVMGPGQFPPRGGNWERLVKAEHPVEQVVPNLEVGSELPDDLFAVARLVLVMAEVLVEKAASFPVGLDFDRLGLLLAQGEGFAQPGEQGSDSRPRSRRPVARRWTWAGGYQACPATRSSNRLTDH